MTGHSATLIAMIAGVAVVSSTIGTKPVPWLVWNASESVPIGLYEVQPVDGLAITDLVVAMPPEPLASFLAQGGYLPRGVPLIKRILALPGQTACRNQLLIIVDGIEMGVARERDRRGRQLPTWQGCRTIQDGQVFLMNWDEPASLDGRYFGPIPLSAIVGRAEPLWTFEEH
jgi:conjugative transfer signal peptidase TraF